MQINENSISRFQTTLLVTGFLRKIDTFRNVEQYTIEMCADYYYDNECLWISYHDIKPFLGIHSKHPIKDIKIFVYGCKGVGKLHLYNSFVRSNQTFRVGERYFTFVDHHNVVSFTIRDFHWKIGKTLDSYAILKAHGIVFMYSVTDLDSFDSIKNLHHQMMNIKEIRKKMNNIVLIGNKTDWKDGRKVSSQDGYELAKKWLCPFYEISALHKWNNIHGYLDLFRVIQHNYKNDIPLNKMDDEQKEDFDEIKIDVDGQQDSPFLIHHDYIPPKHQQCCFIL